MSVKPCLVFPKEFGPDEVMVSRPTFLILIFASIGISSSESESFPPNTEATEVASFLLTPTGFALGVAPNFIAIFFPAPTFGGGSFTSGLMSGSFLGAFGASKNVFVALVATSGAGESFKVGSVCRTDCAIGNDGGGINPGGGPGGLNPGGGGGGSLAPNGGG